MALEILSQLISMSSVFKDQLVRIAGIPKTIALVGDRSILRQKIDKYKLRKKDVSPRPVEDGLINDKGEEETSPELTNAASEDSLGKVDERNIVAQTVDVAAVRYALKTLVTLVVAQESEPTEDDSENSTGVWMWAERSGVKLQDIAQIDRQTAFFYATLLTLGSQYD